jgi:hypothetical protein
MTDADLARVYRTFNVAAFEPDSHERRHDEPPQ